MDSRIWLFAMNSSFKVSLFLVFGSVPDRPSEGNIVTAAAAALGASAVKAKVSRVS